MAMTLKPKLNYRNGSIQKSEDRKRPRQVRSNVKVLLTVFFHCNGVVRHEFLPIGRTVYKDNQIEVMHLLR